MSEHLHSDDIDAYWTGRLPAERVRAFEEHLLACVNCRSQVEGVEELRAALCRPQRPGQRRWSWPAAAALLAVSTLGLFLDDVRWRELAGRAEARREWQQLELEPARRGPQLRALQLAPSVRQVLLKVDMREAGIPGTPFDVWLLDSRDAVVLNLPRLRSAADGSVSVPVPAAQLSGEHLLRLRTDDVVVETRFRVDRTDVRK